MRVIRYCSGVSSCCQCSSVLLIFFGVSVMAMILARAPFLARRTWVLYWEPPRSSRERKSHDDKRGLERTVLRGLRGGRRLRTPSGAHGHHHRQPLVHAPHPEHRTCAVSLSRKQRPSPNSTSNERSGYAITRRSSSL